MAMGAILRVILLDETVVGVALPTIQLDLDLREVTSHWVVNVYMLTLAGLAAVAGRLADIVGHRVLTTGDFQIVFVANAVFTLLVFLIARNGLERS